jgi:hypothetical protein
VVGGQRGIKGRALGPGRDASEFLLEPMGFFFFSGHLSFDRFLIRVVIRKRRVDLSQGQIRIHILDFFRAVSLLVPVDKLADRDTGALDA